MASSSCNRRIDAAGVDCSERRRRATRSLAPVASASVPPRVIDEVLSAIATHIPDIIARHPIASEMDVKKRPTVADGMSIELHRGAEMFYQRASRP
jgi:TRAP-type uncharacterized transport system substrate-binding protein